MANLKDCCYRCWECDKNCIIKSILLLDKYNFYLHLNSAYKSYMAFSINKGIPLQFAEESVSIEILSIITTRMMYRNLNK